ncbi:serine hydrolase domain-containing protein [Acinetobacter sp. WZC-1]|uniref:serine hydrolase domain-containing protein n=1 Tax=Acinetobacter sp. WZC-1 TaxID=3459034 RepID=UPI00403E1FDB
MSRLRDIVFADTHQYTGFVDERFADLAAQFSRFQYGRLASGGAALAVYFQDRQVVNIHTGKKSATDNWQENTLSICYSTGKGILATLAHILVSEGLLDYDVPVAHYWPEFARNGKQAITLRHILSHQSGLYDIRNMIENAVEMSDWPHMLQVMEGAVPRFEPGEDIAYQALSFGWLVGGVMEKATGKTLAALMQNWLVEPLALDGAYFGVPTDQLSRVAVPFSGLKKATATTQRSGQKKKLSMADRLIEITGQNPQDFVDAMVPKGMKNFSFFSNEGLQAVIPAANGAFTADSLARVYTLLANRGNWNDRQMIHPDVFSALSRVQTLRRDRVMPIPMHWRLGYHRVITLGKHVQQGFGHIGYNGSAAWCDPQRQLSFAYTHNFNIGSITGDYRLWGLTQEALRCADAILNGRKGWF